MTSSVEFEEESDSPPVVLDTADFPPAYIYEFDRNVARELSFNISVRDENVNQDLELRAKVSIDESAAGTVLLTCPGIRIPPTGNPVRDAIKLPVTDSQIQRGACNKVEIFVSSLFAKDCQDERRFDLPFEPDDVAHATYWVWDMTGDPRTNPLRAQELLNSCQTEPPMAVTTTPTMMVPPQ